MGNSPQRHWGAGWLEKMPDKGRVKLQPPGRFVTKSVYSTPGKLPGKHSVDKSS